MGFLLLGLIRLCLSRFSWSAILLLLLSAVKWHFCSYDVFLAAGSSCYLGSSVPVGLFLVIPDALRCALWGFRAFGWDCELDAFANSLIRRLR